MILVHAALPQHTPSHAPMWRAWHHAWRYTMVCVDATVESDKPLPPGSPRLAACVPVPHTHKCRVIRSCGVHITPHSSPRRPCVRYGPTSLHNTGRSALPRTPQPRKTRWERPGSAPTRLPRPPFLALHSCHQVLGRDAVLRLDTYPDPLLPPTPIACNSLREQYAPATAASFEHR